MQNKYNAVAMNAIHWKAGVIMHGMLLLYFNNQTMHAESMTFFQNVDQLDMIYASPKQPQSATGSAMAIHKVSGSITIMNKSARIQLERR